MEIESTIEFQAFDNIIQNRTQHDRVSQYHTPHSCNTLTIQYLLRSYCNNFTDAKLNVYNENVIWVILVYRTLDYSNEIYAPIVWSYWFYWWMFSIHTGGHQVSKWATQTSYLSIMDNHDENTYILIAISENWKLRRCEPSLWLVIRDDAVPDYPPKIRSELWAIACILYVTSNIDW